jgi:undecaprenyl-diphosphatase
MSYSNARGFSWLERLSGVELHVVRVAFFNLRLLRGPAVALNRLGDGWIYPILALICLEFEGAKIIPVILAAVVSAGLAHSFYPWLKIWSSRPRPFNVDPTLNCSVRALDEYSFPSGHVMTLTTVLIPLVVVFPNFVIASIVLWIAMAWAGVSLAHHYPSDVVGGGLLGAIIATPISIYVC